MDILSDVNKKIAEDQAEMISSLSDIVSIPSVAVDTEGNEPFGKDVHRAFTMMLEMAEAEGFETFNADNFGGHIDFKGSEDGIVGVVGHLDVVPAGDGWDFDPFGGEIKDGKICGRGTLDDKGPVMASFYAMKALKEAGYEPKKTIRLILGLDEETHWYGMDHYLSNVDGRPDLGFTPDGDFPAIQGEKGIVVFDIVRKFGKMKGQGLTLRSLKGGNAANSVPDLARAVLYNGSGEGYDLIRERAARFRQEKNWKINCKGIGKSLEVTVEGLSAHGAHPEEGENAVSRMMEFLGTINFADEEINELVGFFNDHIGYDLHGERIGCCFEDDLSGRLVFNAGMIDVDDKTAKITVNIRYPITMDEDDVYDGIMTVLDKYDLGIVKETHKAPIYMPDDSPLMTTLMDIYSRHTGDHESKPLIIGGGTYARAMDNVVAFGARFPGNAELGHQKNEYISIDDMIKLGEIYAEAVYRLSEI